MRSNQEMEASNRYKNHQIAEITQGRKPFGWDYWVKLSQKLDKRTHNRLNRIEESENGRKREMRNQSDITNAGLLSTNLRLNALIMTNTFEEL